MALVTFDMAKEHLRVVADDEDDDIQRKLDQASAAILDYCNSTAWWRAVTPTWAAEPAPSTVPGQVEAATLLMLGHLFEHRGDDPATDAQVWEAIARLLARSRDPVLA